VEFRPAEFSEPESPTSHIAAERDKYDLSASLEVAQFRQLVVVEPQNCGRSLQELDIMVPFEDNQHRAIPVCGRVRLQRAPTTGKG
jgi:hypothetical protein